MKNLKLFICLFGIGGDRRPPIIKNWEGGDGSSNYWTSSGYDQDWTQENSNSQMEGGLQMCLSLGKMLYIQICLASENGPEIENLM